MQKTTQTIQKQLRRKTPENGREITAQKDAEQNQKAEKN